LVYLVSLVEMKSLTKKCSQEVKNSELCLPAGASAQAGALSMRLYALSFELTSGLKGSYGRPRRILTILSEALPSQS
jgi:hypothetical protein